MLQFFYRYGVLVLAVLDRCSLQLIDRYPLFKLKLRNFSFSEHFKTNFSFISFFVCLINFRIIFNKAFYRCHCITKLLKSMGKMRYKRNANLHKPHCDLTLLEMSVA